MTQTQAISVILREDVELIHTLAVNSHVWVISTAKVREVCESIWSLKDKSGYSLTHFEVDGLAEEKRNLEKALDLIETHHSSTFDAEDWSEINIYSSSLAKSEISDLLDLDEETLTSTSECYKVIRNNGV